ncbi:response regulator transcription factor [Cohnella zeiphila]|uniref:Response regulator transcription factor n=1 Tax=Cohnella zeiphila TaxID=2761120 RepID=A0A7X0SQT1_9BACL|nr:response regulator transcription factor [Cohnella zeiphila]MBB6732198.1 response regulator transcription factor [Cohnella zeiphila]
MFKVLIVDDEPQIRTGLGTIIPWESFGFVVAGAAEDGEEALALAGELHPDLVITDIKMPGMDGIELSRELRARRPELPILILSGYNEFSYAKEALRYGVAEYLLKPVDPAELSGVLERIYEKLYLAAREKLREKEKTKSLRNLFLGKLVRGEVREEPGRRAEEFGISLSGGRFCVLIVSMERYGELVLSRSEREIGLIRFALENIIEELLGSDGYFFELTEQWFGVLLTGPSLSDGDFVLRTASRIVNAARRHVKENLTVASGSTVCGPERIGESYAEAVRALDRKFYFESEQIFLYEPEDDASGTNAPEWDDSGFLQAIRGGKPEGIREAADRLFGQLERRPVPLERLKHFIMLSIIRLAKLTEELGGDWTALYAGQFREVERILLHGDLQELKELLLRIAADIGEKLDLGRTRKTENRIREIVSHIETNYQADLNLKELSKMFYINAVYLGQLFKKETGEFFNDYINKVRIREACLLLRHSELTASEIAERVGYKYVDHFYRHFKQIHGINPGEYRQRSPK